jgi:hypothetical protein
VGDERSNGEYATCGESNILPYIHKVCTLFHALRVAGKQPRAYRVGSIMGVTPESGRVVDDHM